MIVLYFPQSEQSSKVLLRVANQMADALTQSVSVGEKPLQVTTKKGSAAVQVSHKGQLTPHSDL